MASDNDPTLGTPHGIPVLEFCASFEFVINTTIPIELTKTPVRGITFDGGLTASLDTWEVDTHVHLPRKPANPVTGLTVRLKSNLRAFRDEFNALLATINPGDPSRNQELAQEFAEAWGRRLETITRACEGNQAARQHITMLAEQGSAAAKELLDLITEIDHGHDNRARELANAINELPTPPPVTIVDPEPTWRPTPNASRFTVAPTHGPTHNAMTNPPMGRVMVQAA